MKVNHSTGSFAVGALVLALSAAACGGNDTREEGRGEARGGADDRGAEMSSAQEEGRRASMTLTGCLQTGDDSEFILTQVNDTAGSVGTGGNAETPGDVESRQRAAAANAYRLSGLDDQLRKHVGHQVRVTGMLEERSDLQGGTGTTGGGADTRGEPAAGMRRGHDAGTERQDISGEDLGELEVSSVQSVAARCGGDADRK